jgi:hypothetical protein
MDLESKLLLSTSEPLCLNPNPIVSVWKSKTLHQNGLGRVSGKCYLKKNRLSKTSDHQLDYPFKITKIRKHNFIKTEFSNSIDNMIVKKLKSLSFKVYRF